MKSLLAVIAASATVLAGVGELGRADPPTAPAAQDDPNTADVIYQIPFDPAQVTVELPFNGPYMVAEDFQSADSAPRCLSAFEIWSIYTGAQLPTGMRVQVRADAAGPSMILWEAACAPVSHWQTGYSGWGYPFWYTCVTLPEPALQVSPGTIYWIAMQTVGGTPSSYSLMTYWNGGSHLCMSWWSSDDGSTWRKSLHQLGASAQDFIVVIGQPVALGHETWAEIKAGF